MTIHRCMMKHLGMIRRCANLHQIGSAYEECSLTYGRGMEITVSYNEMCSFSSSYSMLTSTVPSLEGVGQQLTKKISKLN